MAEALPPHNTPLCKQTCCEEFCRAITAKARPLPPSCSQGTHPWPLATTGAAAGPPTKPHRTRRHSALASCTCTCNETQAWTAHGTPSLWRWRTWPGLGSSPQQNEQPRLPGAGHALSVLPEVRCCGGSGVRDASNHKTMGCGVRDSGGDDKINGGGVQHSEWRKASKNNRCAVLRTSGFPERE